MGSCVQGRGAQGGRRLGPKSYSSGASEVTGRCRLTHELTSDGATKPTTASTNLGISPSAVTVWLCWEPAAGPRAPHTRAHRRRPLSDAAAEAAGSGQTTEGVRPSVGFRE